MHVHVWASQCVLLGKWHCVLYILSMCAPWLSFVFFFLFINSDLLQLTCRNSSPNPASQLLTAVKDFQKGMEPYLAAFEGHSKYYLFRFTLGTSKEQSYTTNHLVHVVGLGKPKMLVVCVLSVCCYHYLLVLAIHLCVSIHVYICCSRTVFVLWFLLHIK